MSQSIYKEEQKSESADSGIALVIARPAPEASNTAPKSEI